MLRIWDGWNQPMNSLKTCIPQGSILNNFKRNDRAYALDETLT